MFMYLNYCNPETQNKILINYSNFLKKHKQKQKEELEDKKIIKFFIENPPKSFKDMYIYSSLYTKYGVRLFPQINTNKQL